MLLALVWSQPARQHPIRWLVEAGDASYTAPAVAPLPAQYVNVPVGEAQIAAVVDDSVDAAVDALNIPQIYEHVQTSALSTWIVNHNLGRSLASVRVLTVGGVEMLCDVVEASPNQVVLTFSQPFSGKALVI